MHPVLSKPYMYVLIQCDAFAKMISSGVPHSQCHCAWRRGSGEIPINVSLVNQVILLFPHVSSSVTQELLSPTESDNEDLLPNLSSSAPIGEVTTDHLDKQKSKILDRKS